jgi:aspartate/methionine/tyrosine aminotransferase
MTLEDKVQAQRLHVFRRAEQLGNVSAACLGRRTRDGGLLRSSDDVAAYLVKAGGVVTASGLGFMQDGFVRLSFATPEEGIVSGMRPARQAFEALH